MHGIVQMSLLVGARDWLVIPDTAKKTTTRRRKADALGLSSSSLCQKILPRDLSAEALDARKHIYAANVDWRRNRTLRSLRAVAHKLGDTPSSSRDVDAPPALNSHDDFACQPIFPTSKTTLRGHVGQSGNLPRLRIAAFGLQHWDHGLKGRIL